VALHASGIVDARNMNQYRSLSDQAILAISEHSANSASMPRLRGQFRLGSAYVRQGNGGVDLVTETLFEGNTVGPRLKLEFDLYERYHVMDLKYKFIPNLPQTFGGTIIMGFDYDAEDTSPGDGDEGASVITSWQHSKSGPLTRPLEIHVPPASTPLHVQDALFCKPYIDPRWSAYGAFATIIQGATDSTGSAVADDTLVGYFVVEYDIQFYIPQLEGWRLVSGDQNTAKYLHSTADTDDGTFLGGTKAFGETFSVSSASHSPILALSDGYTPADLPIDRIYSGVYEGNPHGSYTGRLLLEDASGVEVEPGTRWYARLTNVVADAIQGVAGNVATLAVAKGVGRMIKQMWTGGYDNENASDLFWDVTSEAATGNDRINSSLISSVVSLGMQFFSWL
jgi:hypothetical protein